MTALLGLPDWLGKPLGVFLIDILLAGDNALVIGMVCATLPAGQRRGVLAFGTGAAVLLRAALTLVAGSVLAVPGLKLLGGLLLVVLALNLARPEAPTAPGGAPVRSTGVLAAAALVTVLDVLMSLDNVLALAAVAGDSWFYLGLGLLLSISIVMFGSALVADLLGRFPDLTRLGAALLGWTAGQLVLSDGLLGNWITVQAPALPLVVPVLVAAYVFLVGRTPLPVPAARIRAAAAPRPPAPSVVVPAPAAPTPEAAEPSATKPSATKPSATKPSATKPGEPESAYAEPADGMMLLMFAGLFIVMGGMLLLLLFMGGSPVG